MFESFSIPQMGRAVAILRRILELLLVFVLGLLVARLIWLVIEPAGTVSDTLPMQRGQVIGGGSSALRVNSQLLTQLNPFETSGAAVQSDVVFDAPETSLNLTLVGLRSVGDGDTDRSSATIITPDNKTQLFQPGDDILDRVVLDRVLPDRVILSKSGVAETLFRDGHEGGLRVIGGGEAPVSASPQPRLDPDVTVLPAGTNILAAVRPSPAVQNGRLIGVTLSPTGDGAQMTAMGLQPGDILISINGSGPGDFDIEDVQGTLDRGEQLDLQVLRDGEIEDIRLRLGES